MLLKGLFAAFLYFEDLSDAVFVKEELSRAVLIFLFGDRLALRLEVWVRAKREQLLLRDSLNGSLESDISEHSHEMLVYYKI